VENVLWFAHHEQRLADIDATLEQYEADEGDIAPLSHSAGIDEIKQQLSVMKEAAHAYRRLCEDNIAGMRDLICKARVASHTLPPARAQEIRNHVAKSNPIMREERKKLNSTIKKLDRRIKEAENMLATRRGTAA